MHTHHARPKHYLAATHRALAYADAIEWETMPSLLDDLVPPPRPTTPRPARAEMVAQALHKAWFGDNGAWDATRPADLDDVPVTHTTPPAPTLDGLDVREVRDAETFLRYFAAGPTDAAGAARR